MDVADHVDRLDAHGRLLAEHAGAAGLDAPVPTCPGWRVRDLLVHTGSVHRWAADHLLTRAAQELEFTEAAPEGVEPVEWYRRMHRRLTDALAAAPADLTCWYFLKAPSAVAFWARRQAHETAVHRVDAEAAEGRPPTPLTPAFAADGVDELLTGFHGRRRSKVRTAEPRTLLVRAADRDDAWLVRLSPDHPVTESAAGTGSGPAADCTVTAPAAGLYLTLWNRGSYDALAVEGDVSLVDLWRRTSAVV